MKNKDLKKGYELRFRHFIREIIIVSRMKPKEKYIYRIMDGVPFKDLETALLMARINYDPKTVETVNDNNQA